MVDEKSTSKSRTSVFGVTRLCVWHDNT